jgi:hypothetical protein
MLNELSSHVDSINLDRNRQGSTNHIYGPVLHHDLFSNSSSREEAGRPIILRGRSCGSRLRESPLDTILGYSSAHILVVSDRVRA